MYQFKNLHCFPDPINLKKNTQKNAKSQNSQVLPFSMSSMHVWDKINNQSKKLYKICCTGSHSND